MGNALEAGPTDLVLPDSKLVELTYLENPITDAHYYLPFTGTQVAALAAQINGAYVTYSTNCSSSNAPAYLGTSQNSNTFIDALLQSGGLTQNYVSEIVQSLQSKSGMNPIGWQNGNNISYCF